MRRRGIGSLLLIASLGGAAGPGCGPSRAVPTADGGLDAAVANLELFTWWVAPSEVEALSELVKSYKVAYPMARVNQFNDASSANWSSMLAKGIDSPRWDVVQISAAGIPGFLDEHPGSFAPVDAIYDEPSLKAAVIPEILAAATVDGHAMGVVTGVHRNNAFIYNLQLLNKHGLRPPSTLAELLDVCAKLKAVGVTPIATPLDSWIMRFLYLDLLSGVVGAMDFGRFIRHELPVSDETMQKGITAATDLFVTLLTEYVDQPAARATGYDWTKAVDTIHANKAAMIFLGDWVKGYLVHLGWDPGVDFGVSGPPGASDLFVYGADTFAMPTMAPHPKCATDFLAVVASKEAQVAFNKQKGSTPMRTDVHDLLDLPGQKNLDDLVNAKVRLPGIDNAQWDAAMAAYIATGDKAALLQSLLTITP
jgi:glucose/mannose transport system substrate-binding protein